jgi:hypothetical protein
MDEEDLDYDELLKEKIRKDQLMLIRRQMDRDWARFLKAVNDADEFRRKTSKWVTYFEDLKT